MKTMSLNDRERQIDEVTVISSICDSQEFCFTQNEDIECRFDIYPNTPKSPIILKYMNFNPMAIEFTKDFREFTVDYLPPSRLLVSLPHDYPSRKPPNFQLDITWLPPWKTSVICQKLDELWEENEGNEILFTWFNFLKNDIYEFLNVEDYCDISFSYMIYVAPDEYLNWNLDCITDNRARNQSLFLNPLEYMTMHSEIKHKIEFDNKLHTCDICLDRNIGQKCIELKCHHVHCKKCMEKYISTKIKENFKTIYCPQIDCMSEIEINQIKELCPDLFLKYDEFLLRLTLDTMNDVIICPRRLCQCPVIRDLKDNLATCTSCDYNFCVCCRKVYHGVTPCNMTMDIKQIIKDYINGNNDKKKLMEQKHGKKLLLKFVNNHLTKQYLKENAKPCPNCQTYISKVSGCNKMTCFHCQTYFCWLCGECITEKNPYSHFLNKTNKCYRCLFSELGNPD